MQRSRDGTEISLNGKEKKREMYNYFVDKLQRTWKMLYASEFVVVRSIQDILDLKSPNDHIFNIKKITETFAYKINQ